VALTRLELVGLAGDEPVDGGVLGLDHLGDRDHLPRRRRELAAPEGRDPEQILAERFAAGEIDEEEYHRRLQTLRSARWNAGEPHRER
jgi:Short C-terminal domain